MGTIEPGSWANCRYCGAAVRPGAAKCGICGEGSPVPAAELANAPKAVRRRIRLTHGLRSMIVIAAAVGLAYLMISTALSGPPNVVDPLTTAGAYTIGAGNFTILSGNITGGDFVVGNYTTIAPMGTEITLTVYNSTEWGLFVNGSAATPAYSIAPTASGRLIFSPLYTDQFTFVFTNPYPTSSHLTVRVYVTTDYESNVGDDGFG
ncbi:MAG: hypothetical protein ACLQD9_05645 [Thermoplasmata archaeon]